MAGTLTPTPYQTVLDDDGVAVSGAKVYTYEAGTTTNATTYTTSALDVANANPIVADSAGRYVAYLAAGANLRFIIKTSADVTIDDQDNIQSVPGASVNLDLEGTVGEAITAGQVVYLSSGAEASPLTAGLWYLTDSDAAPTSTTAQTIGVAVSAIAINTSGTIRLAGLVTTAGSVVVGTTYYVSATPGAITSSAPALSRQVGVAMTTSTLVLAATTVVAASIPNPISQDLLFVDNTYDIGKSGATRPRDLFTSRNATVGSDIVVSGTGPHAIGGATVDYVRLGLDGAFTSGGASTVAFGTYTSGALTGHSADSAAIAGAKLNNSVVTAGNCTTIAQLWVSEPQITVGSGTVTNSATVYIESAATEGGTANHALWVDSGSTRLDGTLTVGSTAADAIDVAGGINTGSGNVALVNAAGKITALSSTEVADLSGAALTTLNASNISSGTLASARLPTNVDLGGTLDVTGATTLDSTLGVVGAVTFNDAAGDVNLRVETSGNENMLFVDGGEDRVGIGTATPGAALDISHGTGAQPATSGDVATNTALRVSNTGANNTVLDVGADSATQTSWIQSRNRGNLAAGGSYVYPIRLNPNGGDVRVGAGVTFNNDTAAANTLDDYEEGTWSPIPRGSTGSAGTAADNMNGNYTKIGRLVVATCYGVLTNLGSWTGSFEVAGWPFTHGVGQVTQGSIGQFPFGTDGTSAGSWRTVMFPAGGTHCNFREGYNMDTVTPYSQIHGTGFAISVTLSYYA